MSRFGVVLALALSVPVLAAGCHRKTEVPATDAASPSAATASASSQKSACPLRIVPGRSLGSVALGASVDDLATTGLPVKSTFKDATAEFFDVGPLRVSACGGKVNEVWIEDLRTAPDCVSYEGMTLDRQMPRQRFVELFSGCREIPRKGGVFEECFDGGLRVGYGGGDFIQIRVGRAGSSLDDTCEDVLDDGGPTQLSAEVRAKLVERTLDLDALAPYWHPDRPGRDPLRVITNGIVEGTPEIRMFGSKVVYLEGAQAEIARAQVAKGGKPFFELTKLESAGRRVRIEFRYPVEGISGHVLFRKRGDDWVVADKRVVER